MKIEQRISAFDRLGKRMEAGDAAFDQAIAKAGHQNAWFTKEQVSFAMKQWAGLLQADKLQRWVKPYGDTEDAGRIIGVVNAGNIPLVGFHDFLSILISGHRYQGKNAADDSILLAFLAEQLVAIEPAFADRIRFVPRLSDFEAVIATGSNNSARYFTYYFSKYPHIIRRNRNGVALLDGTESPGQLAGLGEDVFRYFGLGCRSVSFLLLPAGYDFSGLFNVFEKHAEARNHHKYCNNYDYYRAVLTLKKVPYLDNGFLILKQDDALASPVSIVNYRFYKEKKEAMDFLAERKEEIQCVVSSTHLPFGSTQSPGLEDYADGVDTMEFLHGSLVG